MRLIRVQIGALALAAAWAFAAPAGAQSIMKVCAAEWSQAKASGTTGGASWQQFLAQCRARQNGAATAAPAPAPAPAPQPAPAAAPAQSVMKQCAAEWSSAKAAGATNGATWRQFLEGCRTRHAGAPAQETQRPWWLPAPSASAPPAPTANAPAPTPSYVPPPRPAAQATGAGQFANESEARGKCPNDTIVWINDKSHVYHYAGTRYYGATERGAYMCEADARASGAHVARNEKHG